jgi:HSP20 family protein
MTTQDKEMAVQTKQAIDERKGEPTRAGLWFVPVVDILENDHEITIRADLPGVTEAGLDIDVRDDVLTIAGSVDLVPDGRKQIFREYDVGGYLRSFTLGERIDQSKISASLAAGVLTLSLPKAEKARPRKVAVTSG